MRIAALLLSAFLAAAAHAADPAPVDPRLQRAQEDLVSVRSLAASVTNADEQAIWQKRIELSEKELANVRQRMAIEAKEKVLQARHLDRETMEHLHSLLRSIETDTKDIEQQVVELSRTIRRLQGQREDLSARLARTPETQTVDRVELDQRIQNADAEIRARTLERDAAEQRVRLAQSALRVDGALREQELSPHPTIRRLLEMRRQIEIASKNVEEIDAILGMLAEQQVSVSDTLALNRERLGHLNEEIRTLENLYQVSKPSFFSTAREPVDQAQRRKQVWTMLSDARSQLRWLEERVKHRAAQVDALQASTAVVQRARELAGAELDNLREGLRSSTSRLAHRIALPLASIAVLFVLSFLLRRVLLPLTLKAETLHVARRAVSYFTGLIALAILALFFLEDLKAIATILGIAGAAVVIALQDLCSGFAGWFAIIASGKVQVGDRIEVDGHRGDVVDIQLLRTTLLEVGNWMDSDEATGRTIVIPNNFIFKSQVFNYSHGHPYIWGRISVHLTYESPGADAQALLERLLAEETVAEFAAAREAAVSMKKRYGVDDANYRPRVMASLTRDGMQYDLFFVSHYRQHDEVRHRLAVRIMQELEQHREIRWAYVTQREFNEPFAMSYVKGQHPLPPG